MIPPSVIAAALETEADYLEVIAGLERLLAAARGTKPTTGRRPQPRVRPRTRRDYTQAPYIPPWAISRGEQG